MSRLLVLSSSGGAGHVRAGQALEAACRERFPSVEIAHHDALEFCGKATRAVVADLYLELVNRAPSLYGFFYRRSDRGMSRQARALVRKYDEVAYRRLAKRVIAFDPDEILCTHFLPAHVMAAKRQKGIRAPVSVVLTDYDAHHFWVNPAVDRYFAGSEDVAALLERRGIPRERIRVAGIPIHPVFSRARGRAAAAREVGVRPERPTVLLMSGGFGVGRVEETLERLLAVPGEPQFLVIAGRNESLRKRLEGAARGARGRVRVFGFVTNIQDLMEASDLAVTKAGGLTVTECLAKGLPMAIFHPIPGQEEANADWLVEKGAAVKVTQPELLPFKVEQVLSDRERLEAMKAAARGAARPRAAFDIVAAVLDGR